MTKLRLLLFEECNRACAGCCNNDWDLAALPIAKDLSGYELVMLTGGEPMINAERVLGAIQKIRAFDLAVPIVMYTAKVDNWSDLNLVIEEIDGMTITLHSQKDVKPFAAFLKDWSFTLPTMLSA